jgi:hypothetical protein
MLIENKCSSYPEMNTRKRELCNAYKPLAKITIKIGKRKNNNRNLD